MSVGDNFFSQSFGPGAQCMSNVVYYSFMGLLLILHAIVHVSSKFHVSYYGTDFLVLTLPFTGADGTEWRLYNGKLLIFVFKFGKNRRLCVLKNMNSFVIIFFC